MKNLLKKAFCATLLCSFATSLDASSYLRFRKNEKFREKHATLVAIGAVLPIKQIVNVVAGYIGPECEEKRIVSAESLLCKRFARVGIAKNQYGDKLPPELLLHIFKFVGTKYAHIKTYPFPFLNGGAGPENVDLIVCSDGNPAVAACGETLCLLNAETLLPRKTLTAGDTTQTCAIIVLPDNKIASAAGEDGIIRIWDIASGECLEKLIGHSKRVRSLALLSDTILASGSWDRTIRLWNLIDGHCVKTLRQNTWAMRLEALSNNRLAVRSHDFSADTINIWDTDSEVCLHEIPVPDDSPVYCLVQLPHDTVAVNYGNHSVRVLDTESGQWIKQLPAREDTRIASLAPLPRNKLAIGYFGAGNIDIISLKTDRCLQTISSPWGACVAQLPGKNFFSIHWNGKINHHRDVIDCNYRFHPLSLSTSSSSSSSS